MDGANSGRGISAWLLMISRQLPRFILVSSGNVLINAVCFFCLVRLGVHYLAASTVGWFVGVVVSFVLNRRFTFGVTDRAWATQFGRYVVGYLVQLLLGWLIYVVCLEVFKLDLLIAYIVNLVLLPALTFAYMRTGVFPSPSAKKEGGEV